MKVKATLQETPPEKVLTQARSGETAFEFASTENIRRQVREVQSLRENEESYRAIVDAFDGLIYICSVNYRLEFMNTRLIEQIGDDATGELCYKILHNRSSACPWCDIERVLEGETVRWEVQGMEDGRWYYGVSTPVSFMDGRISKQAMILDITERKQAEEALKKSSEKLKFFAYSVAHDLKSPTIGIYGLTKRLHKQYADILDEKGKKYCDQILKVSEHIAGLVEKVNLFIATREIPLSIDTINFSDIFTTLKHKFSAQLHARGIDLFEPRPDIEFKGDRVSIVRLFTNLVDNALKYGGERLSKIWIAHEESEDFHIFSVSDNGKGLKGADSAKIFRPFQRYETSEAVQGTGLGLAIVKEIAEQHSGLVWVEPGDKKGITFYVSISKTLRPLQ